MTGHCHVWTRWLAAFSLISSCWAAETQDLAVIRQAVEAYLAAQNSDYAEKPTVRVGNLDTRLHLAACGQRLEVFLPVGARANGNSTAGVRCTGPEQWTIYLPVSVEVYDMVLVAERTLPRGTAVSAAQFHPVHRNVATLPSGYISDISQAAGMRLKRQIGSGAVLTPAVLEKPFAIHRGDQVTIMLNADGVQVRAAGRALTDASPGDRISARNLSSAKVVQGIAVGGGMVEVTM